MAFRALEESSFDFMSRKPLWFGISGLLLIPGIIAIIYSMMTFGSPVRLGIDFTRSNVLELRPGANCGELTGRMVDQPWGDICDGAEKRRMLLQTCEQLGIAPAQAIAVGDGANDLPMMGEAGLSVAYHAKPRVREQAQVAIDSGGLDRLLEIVR